MRKIAGSYGEDQRSGIYRDSGRYGEQETAGYSITVNDLYETGNAIYIDTNLIGPGPEEKGKNTPTYPYIVVKTENLNKSVVFD